MLEKIIVYSKKNDKYHGLDIEKTKEMLKNTDKSSFYGSELPILENWQYGQKNIILSPHEHHGRLGTDGKIYSIGESFNMFLENFYENHEEYLKNSLPLLTDNCILLKDFTLIEPIPKLVELGTTYGLLSEDKLGTDFFWTYNPVIYFRHEDGKK